MKMDPDFIELQAQGITQGATLKSAYILLFKEKGGNNLVPALINKEEKDIIVSGLRTNFSFTSDLISSLCGAFNFQLQYLLFKVSSDSLLTAHLFFLQEGLLHSINVSITEGLAVAIGQHKPIYIYKKDLMFLVNINPKEGVIKFPLSSMNLQLLQEALEQAVHNEEYELADQIKKEIQRRTIAEE